MPSWKKVIISGSDAELNSLNVTNGLTASGLIYPSVDGDDRQVLTTDGSGNLEWSDVNLYARVKNISGGTLVKGTPVHATASASPPSGNVSEVIAASASDATTMPATFVLDEDVADGAEGYAIVAGYINGVNTSGLEEGQVVYVGANGGWTPTKPTGDGNLIQNLGVVTKVDALNGSGYVYGAGRSNDVPNLPESKIWVGSSTYTVTSSVIHLDESNERLGINTNTPTTDLEVSGSALISSAITASTAQFTNLSVSSSEDTVLVIDDSGHVFTKELQYTGGGYVAQQNVASSVWTITHNLNTRPLNVSVFNSNHELIITEDVSFPTVNTARIGFSSAQTGYVVFSSISAAYTASEDNLQMVTNRGNTTTNDLIITSSLTSDTYTLISTGSIYTSHLNTTGSLTASGLIYPTSDGTNGQMIVTDGLGNLSFADTGSGGIGTLQQVTDAGNTTTNDIIITGSLTVTGTGSFGMLHTIYETASVLYSSGSTKFGDTLDDLHEFTGSVKITASRLDLIGGDADIDGDLNIDGGDLTTNTSSFNLINSNATTINAFGAATTINIGTGGIGGGKTRLEHDLNVIGAFTASGLNYPSSDGTANQMLITDGAGNLSFADTGSGGGSVGTLQQVTTQGNDTTLVITGSTYHSTAAKGVELSQDDSYIQFGIGSEKTYIGQNRGVGYIQTDDSAFSSYSQFYFNVGGTDMLKLSKTDASSTGTGDAIEVVNADFSVDYDTLFVNTALGSKRVGINKINPQVALDVVGDISGSGLLNITGTGTSEFTSHLKTHCLGVGTNPTGTQGEIVTVGNISATKAAAEDTILTLANSTGNVKLKKNQYDQLELENDGSDVLIVNSSGTQFFGGAGSYGGKFNYNGSIVGNSNAKFNSLGIGTNASGTAGEIVASSTVTATNFITTSDKRLKKDITAISSGLDTLKQFTAYEYIKDDKPDAGFIAQEVQEVLPYAVFTGSSGYLTMNDRPVLAHMHKAILELEERIKAIEDQLG